MIKQGHELDLWNSSEQPEKKKRISKKWNVKVYMFFFPLLGELVKKKVNTVMQNNFFWGPKMDVNGKKILNLQRDVKQSLCSGKIERIHKNRRLQYLEILSLNKNQE